jgi:hypothetical protein
MLEESEYYPAIEEFIGKKFNCLATTQGKGSHAIGLVDVIGAHEIGGTFTNELELICTEVKLTTASFGKSLGQILGYSLYGERCYLAVTFKGDDNFNSEQIYSANHLGVGLIRVPVDDVSQPIPDKIEVILSSERHQPILGLKQYLLHANGINQCVLCGVYKRKSETHEISRKIIKSDLFSSSQSKRLFVCPDCHYTIVNEKEQSKRQNFKEGARKAILTRGQRATKPESESSNG